jgi:ubiquitin-conjugating enzyme E2 Q
VRGDIREWSVKLFQIDEDSQLANDMLNLEIPWIVLQITFPDKYPLVSPTIHVTNINITGKNGQKLTDCTFNNVWNCTYSVESLIIEFLLYLTENNGRIETK